jgi:mono/diheme cytochrome c family protein
MRVLRFLLILVAVVAVIGLGVLGWFVSGSRPLAFAGGQGVSLADYKAPSPAGVPADFTSTDPIARGQYLARAADCQACHTARGGTPFAGGLAFNLPFGSIWSPNITPDKDTGIGGWTDAQFLGALHRGVDDQGQPLYPAMPYAAFAHMTDADALAIKAYLFSLTPVHRPNKDNTFTFPFNQRWLMAVWSRLFNPDQRFQPHTDRSPQWNRGAYLAEAMAHCGDCHTPRNLAQAQDNRRKYAGAVAAGWKAYNITGHRLSGVGAWSDAELAQYLSTGHAAGRADGRGGGPQPQPPDAVGHLSPGGLSALHPGGRDAGRAAAGAAPRARRREAGPRRGLRAQGQAHLRGRLRELPQLDGAGRAQRMGHAHRRAGGQRSHRHQRRAGGHFRREPAHARRPDLHARLRPRLQRR